MASSASAAATDSPDKEGSTAAKAPPGKEQPRVKYSFAQLLLNPDNRDVSLRFWLTSIVLFLIPVGVFYAALYIMSQGWVEVRTNARLTYAGAAAVLAVQMVLAVYCYLAYLEEMPIRAAVQEGGDADTREGEGEDKKEQ
ncbi:unnamed protein product [Vitrella brassicaformis CCMP3155]|uniref:Vacuolar ATPase assembly integral membrane protein VMA21 homolog n=1 Tax=Vitrella brassicaformis (strain CCMP3155) TaxID=1169540 RepID=A0A0G4EHF2_VITBC|nr:unnamed protein product [Vitrella brassicaformis CCMP3155]|eukprot:CEL95408.1 unnamed protein product [Vitrella brassicaformis CCMP3155]